MNKSQQLPPLNALRAFELAARLGSLTKAAQALGVTQAAVSQQIKSLEGHFDTPLFYRQGRKLTLSQAGQAYLPVLTAAFDRLRGGTSELFGTDTQSLIRVKVANSFAQHWLIPRLPDFYRRYPGFRVRLMAATWPLQGQPDEADLEIANGYGNWAGRHVEQLTQECWQVVASRDFLAQLPPLDDASQLLELPRIAIQGYQENWQNWFTAAGIRQAVPAPILETDTSSLAIEAACSGLGVLLVRSLVAAPDLRRGRLVQIHPATLPAAGGHYLVLPDSEPASPRVTAFCQWLRAELGPFRPAPATMQPGSES
ncbi:LysR substrate-binding domain-containing protein [Marinobacter zhejiangensis]|uniref:Regulatory helix-turn-helix protein, lysR family n=1 Tax=Marinobacter zhejiangensis TaxID=488535 RepID=A0A1I4Q440_9GAMM|nr:LysR substrate-binding domain-containing protein [Marinobacter zhejiangensis]SFM34839.1 regulatory helix-turn-helix protein, lysR family [Marinobacter zhejiangensis]